MDKKSKVLEIIKRLRKIYPRPITALNFENPLQLLIATIMAAQCTDVLVNKVTPDLFKKYPDARAFAKASPGEIDTHVMRLAPKLGLTSHTDDPVKIEEDLMKIVPQKDWADFANMLILAGREFYPKRANDYSAGPLEGLFI